MSMHFDKNGKQIIDTRAHLTGTEVFNDKGEKTGFVHSGKVIGGASGDGGFGLFILILMGMGGLMVLTIKMLSGFSPKVYGPISILIPSLATAAWAYVGCRAREFSQSQAYCWVFSSIGLTLTGMLAGHSVADYSGILAALLSTLGLCAGPSFFGYGLYCIKYKKD